MLKRIALTLATVCLLPLAVGAETPVMQLGAPESQRPFGPLIEAVIRDAGIDPRINYFPAARSRQQFLEGKLDAEFFRASSVGSSGYPVDTITIGPLVQGRIGVFGRHEHKLDNLTKYTVGHIRGNVVIERYVADKQLHAVSATDRDLLYQLLDSARIDLVIDEERFALAHLIKAGMQTRIRELGKPVLEESGYLLLHPAKREFEEPLRKAFVQWQRDGRWTNSLRALNRAEGLPAETSVLAGTPAAPATERRK